MGQKVSIRTKVTIRRRASSGSGRREINMALKKGIEVYQEWDEALNWTLVIKKKKGRLTLDEIKQAARDWEWDYYFLMLDCFHDENECQCSGIDEIDNVQGDLVRLYRVSDFKQEDE